MKSLLFLGLLSVLGIGGVVRSVQATQSQWPVAAIAQLSTLAQDTEEADKQLGDLEDDDQENAQLQSLAKITPQQARQIAESDQGTTATEVELEVEDGSLVYEVEFANETEVYVDAGNGQILRTEAEGQEVDDTTEAPIQGSIQVPNYSDDDDYDDD